MSEEVCREVFMHCAFQSDIAIVEGPFDCACPEDQSLQGGRLEALCQWLDLPRLAVVDVSRLTACRLPIRPRGIDGLLLDRVPSVSDLIRLRTQLESLWGVPVLGALPPLESVRQQLAAVPVGGQPPREVRNVLGDVFEEHARFDTMLALADSRSMANVSSRLFDAANHTPSGIRVAIAFDEAFHCYFQVVLELLELRGATVVDFSPLRDERLPDNADIVYFGCGGLEQVADRLAENHCMKLALRNHFFAGRRIYAEGSGLAYLCQVLETSDGGCHPMVGIFPAVARRNPCTRRPQPVEVTLEEETWLAPAGSRLQGYLNSHWQFSPMCGFNVGQITKGEMLFSNHQAIGSRLQMHLGLQAGLLENFLRPYRPEPKPGTVQTAIV